MIVNTCGWDTDCNSGNLGCLLGLRGGLPALDQAAHDWRGPVADRIVMPTADGGRTVTDAAREAMAVINAGRAMAGHEPLAPKDGARFPFVLPGSRHAFELCDGDGTLETATAGGLRIVSGGGASEVTTPTFLGVADFATVGYHLLASPTLYPGQTVTAQVAAAAGNGAGVGAALVVHHAGADDEDVRIESEVAALAPAKARS